MENLNEVVIGGKLIGVGHPPFIVAEMSGNHNQSIERALEIVEAASKTGVDAIKFQTYTADSLTLNVRHKEFIIRDPKSLWDGQSLYELYQKAYTPWDWHEKLFQRCRELGVQAFSTPFDETAVDFLESLEVPAYKIASFENTHLPLIKKIALTGKPIIISTGMASIAELDETVNTIIATGNQNIILLKCTSTYPASPENTNIRTIPHMRELYGMLVGLSDHTLGIGVALGSIALGSCMVEKHFTLSRDDGGVDSAFSMEPEEMHMLVHESKRVWQGLGQIKYGPTEAEQLSLKFRRSLYVAQDMKKGESFTSSNLRAVRPGYGLPVKYYEILLGKSILKDTSKGTPLSWDLIR